MKTMHAPYSRNKHPGSSLIYTVIFLAALLGFLGISIYLGMNTYLQNELQKAVTTSALIGASSLYDPHPSCNTPPDFTKPTRCAQAALDAATKTFSNLSRVQGSVLSSSSFSVTPNSIQVNPSPGQDEVFVSASAKIDTPFLALVGINSFNLTAVSKAETVKYEIQSGIQPSTPIRLTYPLIDGPGPDLHIVNTTNAPKRGYIVEACSDGNPPTTCADISELARPDPDTNPNGGVMERHYPQDPPNVKRYIIYGDAYIDLGAISSLAHNQIHKASSIRIIDDGYPDVMGTGGLSNMLVELIPQTVSLQKIEIYHMALTCSASQPCPTQNDIAGMQLQPMNIP